jgi:hypothetical protein
MSSILCFRDVRQHDGCPTSDVPGSGAVGVGSVPARDALEGRLRRPVGLGDVSALGTLTRSVTRVNQQHGYARPPRFVLDKRTQLPKRPARESGTLSPSSPHPQAYARQIFEGDSLLRAFGNLDNLFADHVVSVGGKPLFFARELLEAASGGVRALPLELPPSLRWRRLTELSVRPLWTLPSESVAMFVTPRATPITPSATNGSGSSTSQVASR